MSQHSGALPSSELITRVAPGDALVHTAPLGGRNSRVLRLEFRSGRRLVAKRYAERGPDRLDPLEVERQALRFLARHAVERVPRHVLSDRASRWAILTCVPGQAMAGAASEHDVDQLLGFLAELDRLGDVDRARDLPAASEASFSLEQLRRDIARRLARLRGPADGDDIALEMRRWLRRELEPGLASFDGQAVDQLLRAGIGQHDLLPAALRRLSPSDLGFHNALRDDEGRWSFVDFEYFGWDDPAKTVCDLLLHPRAGIPRQLHRSLVDRRLAALEDDTTLPHRLRAYYPLFAVKWCLILLNEFVPRDLERRRRAGFAQTEDPRPRQLERARLRLSGLVKAGLPTTLT